MRRDMSRASVEVELEDEGCGCSSEGEQCADCECTCNGSAPATCGCDCGADGACEACRCACADVTEANACGMKGKKRPRDKSQPGFTREIAFRMEAGSGDGRTMTGYAAVFDTPTRIDSWEGTFDEQIRHGAFNRSLAARTPVLMFEHGHHPLIGSMPLGKITRAAEDSRGLLIEARLSDNWLIEPVRDAVRDGAVTGMSFRFLVPEDGDTWEKRKGDVPLRTLVDVDIPELGPVVFPAYEPTTVSVRSSLDRIQKTSTGVPSARSNGRGSRDVSTRQRTAPQMNYQTLIALRKIGA